MSRERCREIIEKMKGKKVAVAGDLVADEFLLGKTTRISREAPVLILKFVSRRLLPGGGANTAHNIASLGGRPVVVGVLGRGGEGDELLDQFEKMGADTSGIIRLDGWSTIVKTRILAGGENTTLQQVVRLDRGEPLEADAALCRQLAENVRHAAVSSKALVVSDYDGGVVCPAVIDEVNRLAAFESIIIAVDSHHNIPLFRNCTSYTPNEDEGRELLGGAVESFGLERAGELLLEKTGGRSVLLTRGRFGMVLFRPGLPPLAVPVFGSDEIADVTGAGDTVIATFTLALAAGAGFVEAMHLANMAGGIVVTKRGTAAVSAEELLRAVEAYDLF